MERRALVVDRECMARLLDARVERLVSERQRPDPLIDAFSKLGDRQSVSIDSVPKTEKLNLIDLSRCNVVQFATLTANNVTHPHQAVAQRARQRVQAIVIDRVLDAKLAIEPQRLAPQVIGGRRIRHQSLRQQEIDEDAHRERSAAEAEAVDAVAGFIVAAKEYVERENIALQSPADRATEDRERLDRGCAHAIVIGSDLARIR